MLEQTSKKMKRPAEHRFKVQTTPRPKYTYNSHKFQRVLHLIYRTIDGIYGWEVESFTNHKDMWHPTIDTCGDREVYCDCPNFRIKKEPMAFSLGITPNVLTTDFQCKHIQQGVMVLKQIGELPDVPWPVIRFRRPE